MAKGTKNPYKIIISRHQTEKAQVLGNLQSADSNPSVARCTQPKYVFLVDPSANKREIAEAVEVIHADRNVKVTNVNTIKIPSKPRRVRGQRGRTAAGKKAVVTLEAGDSLDNL